MSQRERKHLPYWAEQERVNDLAWIRDNLNAFWPAARVGYETVGRGAVIVATTTYPTGEPPLGYLDQAAIEWHGNEDIARMVGEYNPDEEFVTILFKDAGQWSTYRVGFVAVGKQENKE